MIKLIFISLWVLLVSSVSAASLTFKLNGKTVETISLEMIKSQQLQIKQTKVFEKKLKVYNVFRGYNKTYIGYDLYEILNAIYGNDWKEKKKITFNSIDGYHQMSLIHSLLRSTDDKKNVIAYKEADRDGFTPFIKEGKMIDPGPLYLVWSNFTDKDIASHADTIKWPYQLAEINID
jgi:hypothetical protein